jgi:hypothetical protein
MPAAVEGDSYTTQAHVEQWVQRGTFTTLSKPTLAQVLEAMKLRASEVTSVLLKNGIAASPPSGGATLPVTTASEIALKDLCDLANALAAAGDTIFMHDTRDQANVERAKALWAEAAVKRQEIEQFVDLAIVDPNDIGVRTATSSGGVARADFTDGGEAAELDRGDLFSPTTRW